MKTYTIDIDDAGKVTLTTPDGATKPLESLTAAAEYLTAESAEPAAEQAAEGMEGEMAEGATEPQAAPEAEVRTAKKAPAMRPNMKNSLDELLSAR